MLQLLPNTLTDGANQFSTRIPVILGQAGPGECLVQTSDQMTVSKTIVICFSQSKPGKSPIVFLSYQWGKQAQVKVLYKRLTSLGYTVWMDIYQMGGGDSLYDKIDKGMRGCRAVVSCITEKYTLSANCRREVRTVDCIITGLWNIYT